jgi:hypothetical protein
MRFGCSPFIRAGSMGARSIRPPIGRSTSQPVRGQELLCSNAVDGLGFHSGLLPAANDAPQGRAAALTELQNFVKAANAQRITIFLDVPFNHTAHDTELAAPGRHYWGNSGTTDTAEIRAVEARIFSRSNEYDQRASSVSNIAAAPDRYDVGKWADVSDLYFGRYVALVVNQSQKENYKNESDWFDYSVGSEDGNGPGNGHFDQITQRVWQFFGDYMQFWLTETGYPENPEHAALDIAAGIGGLRADFAQGLPPQAWEYIIKRTRSRK